MSVRVALVSTSEITRAYFEALLFDRAALTVHETIEETVPCELLVLDLDTVSLPRRIPSGCRCFTIGSDGTPDLLRPFTDRDLLQRLFPEKIEESKVALSEDPPRLLIGRDTLALSDTEHRLLSRLLCGSPISYPDLLSYIWGDRGADVNLLRVTVSHLRKKLVLYGMDIKSTRGAYCFYK